MRERALARYNLVGEAEKAEKGKVGCMTFSLRHPLWPSMRTPKPGGQGRMHDFFPTPPPVALNAKLWVQLIRDGEGKRGGIGACRAAQIQFLTSEAEIVTDARSTPPRTVSA